MAVNSNGIGQKVADLIVSGADAADQNKGGLMGEGKQKRWYRANCMLELVKQNILRELVRQLKKWGPQYHAPAYWYAILGEEVGEVGKAICENNKDQTRKELIEVIAVAVNMLISLNYTAEPDVYGNGKMWATAIPMNKPKEEEDENH